MAVDKKLKNRATFVMETLDIDHDQWLNDTYKNFIEENDEAFMKKVSEMQSNIIELKKAVNEYRNNVPK